MNYRYEDGLKSERMVTRFIQKDDASLWERFLKDAAATRFFPKHPLAPAERAVEWTNRQVQRYQDKKYGLQWLMDKDTGLLVGQCGLLIQDVNGFLELEVGYHIFPEWWGKGYATEAAQMFMSYAKAHQLSESLAALIRDGNSKSARVAQKIGMYPEAKTMWNNIDIQIWRTEL